MIIMKIPVMTLDNVEISKKDLPQVFITAVRPDIVKRAVLSLCAHARQPYGADLRAGMKQVGGGISRRRHDYKTSYGHGISRVPRKILTKRGTRFYWVGAVMPGTVGGRRANPPLVKKNLHLKVNKKEKLLALQSALAATMIKDAVSANGHKLPKSFPFIVESKFETLSKTKDVVTSLEKLGFVDELSRTDTKHAMHGKAKMRGRRYRTGRGPLVVVSGVCTLQKAAINIPGVDVVVVKHLNTKMLTHGIKPGRLVVFTDAAVEMIAKEKLFV